MTLPSHLPSAEPATIQNDPFACLGAPATPSTNAALPGTPFASLLTQADATGAVASAPATGTGPSVTNAAMPAVCTPAVYPSLGYLSFLGMQAMPPAVSASAPAPTADAQPVNNLTLVSVAVEQPVSPSVSSAKEKQKTSVQTGASSSGESGQDALQLAYQWIAGQWVPQPVAQPVAVETATGDGTTTATTQTDGGVAAAALAAAGGAPAQNSPAVGPAPNAARNSREPVGAQQDVRKNGAIAPTPTQKNVTSAPTAASLQASALVPQTQKSVQGSAKAVSNFVSSATPAPGDNSVARVAVPMNARVDRTQFVGAGKTALQQNPPSLVQGASGAAVASTSDFQKTDLATPLSAGVVRRLAASLSMQQIQGAQPVPAATQTNAPATTNGLAPARATAITPRPSGVAVASGPRLSDDAPPSAPGDAGASVASVPDLPKTDFATPSGPRPTWRFTASQPTKQLQTALPTNTAEKAVISSTPATKTTVQPDIVPPAAQGAQWTENVQPVVRADADAETAASSDLATPQPDVVGTSNPILARRFAPIQSAQQQPSATQTVAPEKTTGLATANSGTTAQPDFAEPVAISTVAPGGVLPLVQYDTGAPVVGRVPATDSLVQRPTLPKQTGEPLGRTPTIAADTKQADVTLPVATGRQAPAKMSALPQSKAADPAISRLSTNDVLVPVAPTRSSSLNQPVGLNQAQPAFPVQTPLQASDPATELSAALVPTTVKPEAALPAAVEMETSENAQPPDNSAAAPANTDVLPSDVAVAQNLTGRLLPNAVTASPQLRGPEKFASPISQSEVEAKSGVNPSIGAREKKSLYVDGKALTATSVDIGTSGANRELVMPYSAPNKSPDVNFSTLAGANLDPGSNSVAAQPVDAPVAAHATKLVQEIREIADRISVIDRNSVEVRFDFSATEHLSVRVEYRDGTVHTTFTTDSAQLRDAISHEWQTQTPNEQRPYRVAEPVFSQTSPDRQNFASQGGDSGRQRTFEQPAQSTPSSLGAPGRNSFSTPSPAVPAARSARPETSHHLHALA